MIRAMTFNVRYGEAGDGENSWPYRKHFLFETVRRHDPDLVGFQEPDANQCRELDEVLRGRWTGIFREGIDPATPDAHGKALYYRAARFTEAGRGVFWISETPAVPGSILQPNQWGQRTGAWVKLRDRENARELCFVCTHFDTHPGCSLRSAEILAAELAKVTGGMPTIAVGDFNAPAGGAAWQHLTAAGGFRDAWREARTPEAGVITYNAWDPRPRQPADERELKDHLDRKYGTEGLAAEHARESLRVRNERIDWVLLRGPLTCSNAAADTTLRDGRCASDHFAVVADLDWTD